MSVDAAVSAVFARYPGDTWREQTLRDVVRTVLESYDPMLTPAQVAARFGTNPKTVGRWARAGRIPCVTTPGGHRRFRESDVRAALEDRG